MMTSKDTIHILRLAAVLHVFQHSFSCGLNDGCYTPTPLEITKSRLKQAMVLYNSLSQQKSLFVQVSQIILSLSNYILMVYDYT